MDDPCNADTAQAEPIATTARDDGVPEEFICPLTMDVMREPVVDRSGHTYECSAIFEWIRENGTCPLTRKPVKPSDYIRNAPLKIAINAWRKTNADSTKNRRRQQRQQHGDDYDGSSSEKLSFTEATESESEGDFDDSYSDFENSRIMLFIGSIPDDYICAADGDDSDDAEVETGAEALYRRPSSREQSEVSNAVRSIIEQQQRQQQQQEHEGGPGSTQEQRQPAARSQSHSHSRKGRLAKLFRLHKK